MTRHSFDKKLRKSKGKRRHKSGTFGMMKNGDLEGRDEERQRMLIRKTRALKIW